LLEGGDGFVHGVVIFAEGDSGCTWLRGLVGFGDVGSGFVSEVADSLDELGECIARDVGVQIVEMFIEEMVDQEFGFLETFPSAFTSDLETKVPKALVFGVIGFDGGESGAGKMLTPFGGALGPIVAGTEVADGFVRATGFFGDICEARLWAEIEVNGKCGEGISGFVGEALPELRTGILGCGIVVLIHKGLVVWDIWDILGHLGPISGKKICPRVVS